MSESYYGKFADIPLRDQPIIRLPIPVDNPFTDDKPTINGRAMRPYTREEFDRNGYPGRRLDFPATTAGRMSGLAEFHDEVIRRSELSTPQLDYLTVLAIKAIERNHGGSDVEAVRHPEADPSGPRGDEAVAPLADGLEVLRSIFDGAPWLEAPTPRQYRRRMLGLTAGMAAVAIASVALVAPHGSIAKRGRSDLAAPATATTMPMGTYPNALSHRGSPPDPTYARSQNPVSIPSTKVTEVVLTIEAPTTSSSPMVVITTTSPSPSATPTATEGSAYATVSPPASETVDPTETTPIEPSGTTVTKATPSITSSETASPTVGAITTGQ